MFRILIGWCHGGPAESMDELRSKDTHTHTHTLMPEWFPEVVCQVIILLVSYTCFHEKVWYLGFVRCTAKTGIMETHLVKYAKCKGHSDLPENPKLWKCYIISRHWSNCSNNNNLCLQLWLGGWKCCLNSFLCRTNECKVSLIPLGQHWRLRCNRIIHCSKKIHAALAHKKRNVFIY